MSEAISEVQHPLRILHVILVLRPTNGQYNEHCLPLMDEREITICTYFESELTPPSAIRVFEGDGSVTGFFRAFRAALAAGAYDVIHVHTPHAGILVLAALFKDGLYRQLRPSLVHTIQNSYQSFQLRHKLMFVPSFPFFQRLVFCSEAARASFPSFLKRLGRGRMHVVQNAVDLHRIDSAVRSAAVSRTAGFRLVSVGLITIKDPVAVFEAFRDSRDDGAELLYLGEGELRASVEDRVAEAGLQDRVTVAGMVDRDRVFEEFSRADAFVSASWGEGLPVAVLEAMACRCPVVLSDIPPHREIAAGVDFIPLVEPGDVAGFAREIRKMREMPAVERADLGDRCRSVVEKRFSLRAMHTAYREIYSEIAAREPDMPLRSLEVRTSG